jgi:hypoxia up-regulated 1
MPLVFGQILAYAANIATNTMGSPVKDFSITVPPFWTHSQRQALLDAAKIAGVNVLSLINQNAAIALNFGIERTFKEPEHVIFYDMGASNLQVSLYKFTSSEDKKKKTFSGAQLLAQAWDDTLGGRAFDQAIVDYVLSKVQKEKKITVEAKGLVKLQKAVKKAKEILTANKDTTLGVDSLVPDFDLRMKITREEVEGLFTDLFVRALEPVKRVLATSGLTVEQINAIEIVGGGVRIPKIQQLLQEHFNREQLDKHLNGDEAAVFGAALYAASISAQHRTREFKFKDAQFGHFPILVSKTGGITPEDLTATEESTEQAQAEEEEDDSDASSMLLLLLPPLACRN